MTIQIDHVVIAGNDLESMRTSFTEVGLPAENGGIHADGLTYNALLGFADGSYLELIAPTLGSDLSKHGWGWGPYMTNDAGVCAWAIRTDDIARDVAAYRARGIAVQEPQQGGRTRPDGTRLDWITAALGDGPMGSLLPFLIQDVTPRANRVPSTTSVENVIAGVTAVFIGVAAEQHDRIADLVQRAFDLPAPHTEGLFTLFPNAPIGLVRLETVGIPLVPAQVMAQPRLFMAVLQSAKDQSDNSKLSHLSSSRFIGLQQVRWFYPHVLSSAAQTWLGVHD